MPPDIGSRFREQGMRGKDPKRGDQMRMMAKRFGMRPVPALLLATFFSLLILAGVSRADGDPAFVIKFKDGAIEPAEIVVPADVRFKLELHNVGVSPVEFESIVLRKEKVLGPGASSFIVIRRLDPGEYEFFDDFHLDMPPARLIAR